MPIVAASYLRRLGCDPPSLRGVAPRARFGWLERPRLAFELLRLGWVDAISGSPSCCRLGGVVELAEVGRQAPRAARADLGNVDDLAALVLLERLRLDVGRDHRGGLMEALLDQGASQRLNVHG